MQGRGRGPAAWEASPGLAGSRAHAGSGAPSRLGAGARPGHSALPSRWHLRAPLGGGGRVPGRPLVKLPRDQLDPWAGLQALHRPREAPRLPRGSWRLWKPEGRIYGAAAAPELRSDRCSPRPGPGAPPPAGPTGQGSCVWAQQQAARGQRPPEKVRVPLAGRLLLPRWGCRGPPLPAGLSQELRIGRRRGAGGLPGRHPPPPQLQPAG